MRIRAIFQHVHAPIKEKEYRFILTQAPLNSGLMFRHALLQEIAYESLLRKERLSFHKQVANMLRDKYPKTIARSPEEFARHCEGGGEYEAAAIYYLKAGEQAILKSASIEAVDLISKTLSLSESIDDPIKQDALELQAHITIGAPLQAAKGFADPNVLETYERALQLNKNIGD